MTYCLFVRKIQGRIKKELPAQKLRIQVKPGADLTLCHEHILNLGQIVVEDREAVQDFIVPSRLTHHGKEWGLLWDDPDG